MILVETSIWVSHLWNRVQGLIKLRGEELVVMHSAINGDLGCGKVPKQAKRIDEGKTPPRIVEFNSGDALWLVE